MSDPQGLVYDAVAEDYERGRTTWPSAVADGVEGGVVLDLAAGTGKLSRVLVRRFDRVLCVEPLDAMRAVGARVVPQATWLRGAAEVIPLPDGAVDAAFAADAFHWFDARLAVQELARVIRPGGTLIVTFTSWDGPFQPALPPRALAAIAEVSDRTGPTGAPKVAEGAWRAGFEGAPFDDLGHRDVRFEHGADREGVIAYYRSMSTVAARTQGERDGLAATLRALLPDVDYRLRACARVHRMRRR